MSREAVERGWGFPSTVTAIRSHLGSGFPIGGLKILNMTLGKPWRGGRKHFLLGITPLSRIGEIWRGVRPTAYGALRSVTSGVQTMVSCSIGASTWEGKTFFISEPSPTALWDARMNWPATTVSWPQTTTALVSTPAIHVMTATTPPSTTCTPPIASAWARWTASTKLSL